MITWALVSLELPASAQPAGEAFWSAALDRPFAVPSADQLTLEPGQPARVHLDLVVTDLAAETDRLLALGAALVTRGTDRVSLSSPGGAVFGLVSEPVPQHRPPPVVGPDGVRRRLVQVCLDIPHGRGDAETAFWRGVLPWRWAVVAEPEFLGRLEPPPGAPLQVLLQELGCDDSGTAVRLHLDLGSDDLEATAAQLVGLGAVRVGAGDGFVVLRDPAGMAFCVTRHSPDKP